MPYRLSRAATRSAGTVACSWGDVMSAGTPSGRLCLSVCHVFQNLPYVLAILGSRPRSAADGTPGRTHSPVRISKKCECHSFFSCQRRRTWVGRETSKRDLRTKWRRISSRQLVYSKICGLTQHNFQQLQLFMLIPDSFLNVCHLMGNEAGGIRKSRT